MKFLALTIAALASLALATPFPAEGDEPSVIVLPDNTDTWPTRVPPPPPKPTTTSTSTSFTMSITTLPPVKPTTSARACPTITLTTRPSGCEPIRCPIPGCTYEQEMFVPCGCSPRTLLSVEGCQTACPTGCATRTSTLTQLCGTATGLPAQTPV